jgi:hypothetical protein
MIQLCRTLTRLFELPLTSPHEGGRPLWTLISQPRSFRGFLGHYHLCNEKWDPGCWDFPRLLRGIGSRLTFPLTPLSPSPPEFDLASLAATYYEKSEQEVEAHFPVGPLGHSRLWHGGVHLKSEPESPVYAVLQGRIVAARLGPPCPIGSCNFILIRHQIHLSELHWTFFSLYYHLATTGESTTGELLMPWLKDPRGAAWREALESGQIIYPEIMVEAGELIGAVGEAGPEGSQEGQIHFAIFSAQEQGAALDPGHWQLVQSHGKSRFCHDRQLLRWIDRPLGRQGPDGLLSRRELRNFFEFNPRREQIRRIVLYYPSEWTDGPWAPELEKAPDFADLPPAQRRRLIAQQITPTLWWTSALGQRLGLPSDGMIYAYHPIGFLHWFHRLLLSLAQQRSAGIEGADRWQGKLPPKHLTLDRESGDHMTDEEDYVSGEQSKNLTLEDLANGYPDDL